MTALKSLLFVAALLVLPLTASAQSAPPLGKPVFCKGVYALCIKALCQPVVGKGGKIEYANCACDVQDGWSMGPGSCESRHPLTVKGRTFITSTYSNLYNDKDKTMSCTYSGQTWAWCYGAPCVIDRNNPKATTCTCPVYTGPMYTLGGACGSDSGGCDSMWSAATPKADEGANALFAAYMKKNGYPHNGPAAMCPATSKQ